MTQSVVDLINNIENGTLADAEQVFNDIMDLKAGAALDAHRETVASNMFDDPQDDEDDQFEDDSEDDTLEDAGEDDADL